MNHFSKNIHSRMKTTFLTYVFYSATVAFGDINTPSTEDSGHLINAINPIELYFKNFETLTKLEDWKEAKLP